MNPPKLKILFLCTGNSCRSQMAEGFARHLKAGAIDAYSAGIETHGLNPRAVQVMAEAGVDISGQTSKRVETLLHIPFDYVLTVCGHASEVCPVFPGNARVLHVGFDDPPALAKTAASEEEALGHYRRVRDEIRDWVMTLPESLERTRMAASRNRTKPGVLILCAGNSARSQMAEGLLRSLAGGRFDVHSAGMEPAENIHPLAIQVMGEAGIDIQGQWPKNLRAYLGRSWFQHVIFVCPPSEKSCPRLFMGASNLLIWPIPNPAAEGDPARQLAAFRGARDELNGRIRAWLETSKDGA